MVIRMCGKAEVIFDLFAALAKKSPNKTIGQIVKESEYAPR